MTLVNVCEIVSIDTARYCYKPRPLHVSLYNESNKMLAHGSVNLI